MRLSPAGEIVSQVWQSLPERYPQIELGPAVVMPDHFHGVIEIKGGGVTGVTDVKDVTAIHELPLPDLPLPDLPLPDPLLQGLPQGGKGGRAIGRGVEVEETADDAAAGGWVFQDELGQEDQSAARFAGQTVMGAELLRACHPG